MLTRDVADIGSWAHGTPPAVVVGSGAVGLFTAMELARRGRRVLVVEAGGLALGSFDPESYISVGRHHEGVRVGRSRTLGGTTNLWGGQLAELQEVDLAGRDWLPGSAWPLSYRELEPFYRSCYESLGFPPDAQRDDEVWRSLRMERPELGHGLEVFLTRWLAIPNFAVRTERDLRDSRNLVVLTNHTATRFHGEGGRATAVTVVDGKGAEHRIPGACFVLAAGTIETSRLLLAAAEGSGWRVPWRKSSWIGARFQDHLGGRIAEVHPIDSKRFFATFSNAVVAGRKYQPKLQFDEHVRSTERVLNVHGMFAFESSVSENLLYLRQFAKAAMYGRKIGGLRELLPNLRASAKYLVPVMWTYAREHRMFEPRSSRISFFVQMEQIGLNESCIRTDASKRDAAGLPRVVLDWRVAGDEVGSLREFAMRADRALRAAGLARLDIDEALLRNDPAFLTTLRDTNHHAGGAIMAHSGSAGLVDDELRIFGTDNVYVGGAATFPTIGAANTTFTALALSVRLAEQLASRHGS